MVQGQSHGCITTDALSNMVCVLLDVHHVLFICVNIVLKDQSEGTMLFNTAVL